MTKRLNFSVPYSVDLTEESAWEAHNEQKTSFSVVRCHFQLNERLVKEQHKVGDTLAVYKSPKGISHQHVTKSSFEREIVHNEKSIKSYIASNENIAKFAGELIKKAKALPFLSFTLSAKTELSKKLSQQWALAGEMSEEYKFREKIEFEIQNSFSPDITEAIVAVPAFKRKAYDLILGYVDFLQVEYERSSFGLRRKSRKKPIITASDMHPNVVKFGIPIATIFYWEFLPKSSVFMLESEHSATVEDPDQICFSLPECEKERYVEFPAVPTLYQIANAAFPFKWIWRQSKKNEWTEAKLKEIELEEVKKMSNGWWHKYGLGSRRA